MSIKCFPGAGILVWLAHQLHAERSGLRVEAVHAISNHGGRSGWTELQRSACLQRCEPAASD